MENISEEDTQALYQNEEAEELYNAIEEPAQIDENLKPDEALYYTRVKQDLEGEDATPITVQSELDNLNRYQSDRMDEERREASIQRDVEDIAAGTIDAEGVKERALAEARLSLEHKDHLDSTAASQSAAIEQRAIASIEEPESLNAVEALSKAMDSASQKAAIVEDYTVRQRAKSTGWDVAGKFATYAVPAEGEYKAAKLEGLYEGEDQGFWLNAAKAVSAPFRLDAGGSLQDLKNAVFADLTNPELTPEQFKKKISTFVKAAEEAQVNPSTLADFLEEMAIVEQNPWVYVEAVGDVASYIPIVGGTAKIIKGLSTGARAGVAVTKAAAKGSKASKALGSTVKVVKRATKQTGKLAVEEFTPVPLVGLATRGVTKGGVALYKAAKDLKSLPDRLVTFGRTKKAARVLADLNIDAASGSIAKGDLAKALEDTVETAAKPAGQLSTSLSRTKEVQSSNVFNDVRKKISQLFHRPSLQVSLEGLKGMNLEDDAEYLGRLREALKQASSSDAFKALKQERWADLLNEVQNAPTLEKTLKETNGLADLQAFDTDLVRQTEQGALYATARLKKQFNTQEEAVKAAEGLAFNNGHLATSATVVPSGEKFSVDLTMKSDRGWGTLQYNATSKGTDPKTRSMLSSVFTHSSMPQHIAELNSLRVLDASAVQATGQNLIKSYKALNKEERALFDTLQEKSLEDAAWYSKEHLLARGVPEKVAKAYEDSHIFGDLDYMIRNKARRADMIEMGLKQVSYGTEDMGAAAVFKGDAGAALLNGTNKKVVFGTLDDAAANDNSMLSSAEKLAKQLDTANAKDVSRVDKGLLDYYKTMVRSGKYHVVKKFDLNKSSSSGEVFLYVLPSDRVIENNLPTFVLNYLPGPRRFFDRSAGFVKQLNISKAASGNRQILGAKTLMTDKDLVGLGRTTEALEEIRKLAAKGTDEVTLTKAIQESSLVDAPFDSASSFKEWAEGVGLDIENVDNTLEVVHNGSMLSSYERLSKLDDIDDLVGEASMMDLLNQSAYQGMDRASRIAKGHRSGRDVLDFNWDKARVVDFEKSIGYMVKDMVNNGTMRHFTDFYAESFVKTYGSVLRGAQDMSLRHALMYATIDMSKPLGAAAEAARRNYMAMRGVPTDWDQTVAKTFSNICEAIGIKAENLFHISGKTAHGLRTDWNKVLELDPLKFMRATAAHMYLGCANISQLWKQASSVAYIGALAGPQATWKAFRYAHTLTSALLKSDTSVEKAIAKLATEFKDSPEELKIAYKNLIKLGAQQHGLAGGLLEAGQSTLDKVSKMSFAPFNLGEMYNRTMAYLAALSKEGFDGKLITSATDLARVRKQADLFFLNMDQGGLSRMQVGTLGKTALQMVGYRMRVFETLLAEPLTTKQRFWLGFTMANLTGVEGLLGAQVGGAVTDFIFNIFGDNDEVVASKEDKEFFKQTVAEGTLNAILTKIGIDIDLGSAFSFNWLDSMDQTLGETLMNLPSVTASYQLINGIRDACKATWNLYQKGNLQEFRDQLTVIARRKEFPASINRLWLASEIYRTGFKFNSRGLLTGRDQTLFDSALYALGMNSQTEADVYRKYLKNRNREEYLKDFEKNLSPMYTLAVREGDEQLFRDMQAIVKNSDLTPKERNWLFHKLSKGLSPLTTEEKQQQYLN